MKFVFLRKKRIWFILPVLLAFLAGCCILHSPRRHAYRVIQQVQVVYQNGAMESHWQFYSEGSIRVILEYLRHIDPYGRPREDPEAVTGRDYVITLVYSDGSQRVYHQRADLYMCIDGGDWKRIDEQTALYLSGLLGMMPSEDAPVSSEPVPPLLCPKL